MSEHLNTCILLSLTLKPLLHDASAKHVYLGLIDVLTSSFVLKKIVSLCLRGSILGIRKLLREEEC